jgi:SH3-like domain-containing protein
VEQLSKTDQWYQIRLPGGSVGWIFEELLEPNPAGGEIDQ